MPRSSIFVILAAFVLAAPAGAESGDNQFGPAELHPYLKLSEIYDSNIFLQPRSRVRGQNANGNTAGPVLGSWIHTVNAGMKAALSPSTMHRLDLAYDAVYKAYKKDPRQNNTVNQGVDAAYVYSGPMGLTGRLKNTYVNTVDPATSELTTRKRRWQNTGAAELEYAPEGGALTFGVDAAHTVHKYVAKDATLRALNRYEQLFGVKAGYRVMPKTRVFLGYHRQIVHYTNHPAVPTKNSKSHLAELGVDGQLAPKLIGSLQAGLQHRKLDDAPASGLTKVANTWIATGKLGWRPLERTKADLTLSRSLQESTFARNPYYAASAAALSVVHKFPGKVSTSVHAAFEQDKYPHAATVTQPSGSTLRVNRRDDIYQYGATLDYDIQAWLKTGISYLYRTRYSHRLTEQFNYEDHQAGVTIGLVF